MCVKGRQGVAASRMTTPPVHPTAKERLRRLAPHGPPRRHALTRPRTLRVQAVRSGSRDRARRHPPGGRPHVQADGNQAGAPSGDVSTPSASPSPWGASAAPRAAAAAAAAAGLLLGSPASAGALPPPPVLPVPAACAHAHAHASQAMAAAGAAAAPRAGERVGVQRPGAGGLGHAGAAPARAPALAGGPAPPDATSTCSRPLAASAAGPTPTAVAPISGRPGSGPLPVLRPQAGGPAATTAGAGTSPPSAPQQAAAPAAGQLPPAVVAALSAHNLLHAVRWLHTGNHPPPGEPSQLGPWPKTRWMVHTAHGHALVGSGTGMACAVQDVRAARRGRAGRVLGPLPLRVHDTDVHRASTTRSGWCRIACA